MPAEVSLELLARLWSKWGGGCLPLQLYIGGLSTSVVNAGSCELLAYTSLMHVSCTSVSSGVVPLGIGVSMGTAGCR